MNERDLQARYGRPGGAIVEAAAVVREFPSGAGVVRALDGVDVRVERGELLAVRGRSGSGKTSLLNVLGGLDRPTEGQVRVDGRDLASLGEAELVELRRRTIAFVFQAFGLLPILTAAENVEVPLRLVRADPVARDARVAELLELVGLSARARHRPFELSGGEQQRVAIARSLANRPKVLFADEPTGQLDSETGRTIMRLIRSVVDRERIAAVVATHDPIMLDVADRVIELRDGRLVSAGPHGSDRDRSPAGPGRITRPVGPVGSPVSPKRLDQTLTKPCAPLHWRRGLLPSASGAAARAAGHAEECVPMTRPSRSTSTGAPRPTPAPPLAELLEPPRELAVGLAVDRLLAGRLAERPGRGHGAPAREPEPEPEPEPIVTIMPVRGMTCRSCEVRIQKFVGRLPNVERVTASALRGRVEIESSERVSPRAIERAINKAGYEIGRNPWLERDPRIWVTAGAGVLLVAVVAVLAQVTGLAGLAGGAGDLASGGLVVALLLGLAAGVSTCAALVGGLVLALSASFQARRRAQEADEADLGAQMRPALVFMVGRVAGYAAFGALLGAVGASLAMPPQLTATLMIGAAIVMTIVGARLTGLSPRVATWSPTLPMGLGDRLGLGGSDSGAYSDGRAATLGALSFFLPCGFTQAVQIYALSTGSPLFAGALLATFAIGTAPGLLALAGLPVVVPSGARPTLLRLVGVGVIGFALLNASSGLRLSGVQLSFPGIATAAAAAPPAGGIGGDGVQVLTTYQEADGYSPSNVSIYAGTPTRWTIESKSSASCATSLVVPSLGISKHLKPGANEIDLPALPAGTLTYSCAMGMFGGAITVVEKPAGG